MKKAFQAMTAATMVIGALSLSTAARADNMHSCGGAVTYQNYSSCGVAIASMEKMLHEMKMARHHMHMMMMKK